MAKTRTPVALATKTLTFDATCAPGRRAVIAAVGDLLFHDALQAQALKPARNFRAFWGPVASVLADADLTYGNLETPLAAGVRAGGFAHKDPGRTLDRIVYGRKSDALIFNTHPSAAVDLAASGFDIVSTANNHTADRGVLGMDRTLDALDAAGLAHTGVRRSSSAPAAPSWSTRTTTANGVTVAWLACTYGLNGMPDPKAQVLHCYRDRDTVLNEIRALAADPSVDAVLLTPHWGSEGAPTPLASDRVYARDAIDAGATAVIGTHPHVIQPWEKYVSRDGRNGLILYSTGNFVSNQPSDDQRTGMIALLEVTKPDDGTPARLSAAGYIPTFVEMTASTNHRVVERKDVNASIRRLPAGNRVSLATYRTLPRACAPAPPVAVAVAQRPAEPLRVALNTDTAGAKVASSQLNSGAPPPFVDEEQGGGSAEAVEGVERSQTVLIAPSTPRVTHTFPAMRPLVPQSPVFARRPSPLEERSRQDNSPPQRAPAKQDPMRSKRLRLEQLAMFSTPELVSARVLWHVPQRPPHRPQAQWIAPPQTPAASRSRPSPSPSPSLRSKSRRTRPPRVLRSTPTRSNRS